MNIASRPGLRRRPGPSDPALRVARVCYDHLAGERGVWLFNQMRDRNLLTGRDGCDLSPEAGPFFARLGIDIETLPKSRRPLCRPCLDWSERRPHLAGSLAAAILTRLFTLRWARRESGSRAVSFSAGGERSLRELFGKG
jgi:hypothetical protein